MVPVSYPFAFAWPPHSFATEPPETYKRALLSGTLPVANFLLFCQRLSSWFRPQATPRFTCNLCMYSNNLCSSHNTHRGSKHSCAGFLIRFWFLHLHRRSNNIYFSNGTCSVHLHLWVQHPWVWTRICAPHSPHRRSSSPCDHRRVREHALHRRAHHLQVLQPWLQGYRHRWSLLRQTHCSGIRVPDQALCLQDWVRLLRHLPLFFTC